MIVAPPLPGAAQVTVASPLPRVALTAVGAPGLVAGVTALEAAESEPAPTALTAWTLNVYVVPLARPVTTAEVAAPSTVACWPPGEAVTTNDVMELPPSAGAAHETVAEVSPGTAVPIAGASGTVAGVTAAEDADSGPSPTLLVAWTVKV